MDAKESEGCCHDEQQVVKLVQDQRTPETFNYTFTAPATFEAALDFYTYTTLWKSEDQVGYVAYDPPEYPSQELYLLNRVFRL